MIGKILDLYAKSGMSLDGRGISEAAIPLDKAHCAIDLFFNAGWIVLGGDVYTIDSSGAFTNTYDSWHYDGNSGIESAAVAKEYISNIKSPSSYIVFVLKC